MSFSGLLKHRCDLYDLNKNAVDGAMELQWVRVSQNIKCYLDLAFIRRGKDPMWTPEAGRPSDRSGVLFLPATADLKSGMRIEMVRGPVGQFEILGAIDLIYRRDKAHHYEIGVVERATSLSRRAISQEE